MVSKSRELHGMVYICPYAKLPCPLEPRSTRRWENNPIVRVPLNHQVNVKIPLTKLQLDSRRILAGSCHHAEGSGCVHLL